MKTTRVVSEHRTSALLTLLVLVASSVGEILAAPPSRPPPVPTVADVAYMSISTGSTSSSWQLAAIRGMSIDAAGVQSGDVEILKAAERYTPAITWDPDGQYLVWAQAIDRKGTRALMIGAPGATPRLVYTFSSVGLRLAQMSDGLASGRGCGSNPVVYFRGIMAPGNSPTLWVVDPFAASPQPRELYQPEVPPPDDTGGSLHGIAVSPLGRMLVFGAYSSAANDRAAVALPLVCSSVAALPEAAGQAVPLFPARFETDKAWIQSFDWSRDGRRLAISMGRWVASPGGAYIYDPELWVADLNYAAAGGSEQAGLLSLSHLPSGVAAYASWAPSVDAANCDRLAFVRSGALWVGDVPREGFRSRECAITAPTPLGGTAVDAMDWK